MRQTRASRILSAPQLFIDVLNAAYGLKDDQALSRDTPYLLSYDRGLAKPMH
jgi:hypothetical protein